MPSPPIHLNEIETAYYARVMAAIAPSSRTSAPAQMLAAGIAQAAVEIDQCSAILAKDGLIVTAAQGVKPHPCVQIRDAAAKRLAALAARIKALPQGDARELQRAVKFESVHRTSAPVVATSTKEGPKIDWVKALADEVSDG